MRYALAIALMLTLSFGLITESFRYQSTARIWEDDYDLLFDPARIPQIEGSRLWTGLANLVSGSEELFSNSSQPYLLIGGVTHYNDFFPAAVYDRSVIKTPTNTGLEDPMGNPIYGDGMVETIDWTIDPSNGDSTAKVVTTEYRTAFDRDVYTDYYVALGTKMNSLRLGLGYLNRSWKQTITDPGNNYDFHYFTATISPDSTMYDTLSLSSGDEITSSGENEFVLSGWMDKEQMAIGADFRYAMLTNSQEAFIAYGDTGYSEPEDPSHLYTFVDGMDSVYLPESGSRIAINVKVFYDWTDMAQGRFYGGYFMKSTSYDDEANEYLFETTEFENDPEITYDTTQTSMFYTGDFKESGFRLGTKQLFTVSEKFHFGFGFFWSMWSVNDSINRYDSTYSATDYTDGDTLVDNSYYTYTWESERWAQVTDGSVNSFNIPVGMEFFLAKNFVLRFGADHTVSINDLTTTHTLEAWDPQYTYYYYTDLDSSYYYYSDPGSRPENTSENDTRKTSTTTYSYGVGWMVTDNLQIDFMNFNDLTDLGDWRLSATLHLD